MTNPRSLCLRLGAALLTLILLPLGAHAAEPATAPGLSARELANRLAAQQEGTALVRLRMEIRKGGGSSILQVQIKERRSRNSADVLYQVLWPKERKGEAVLLHRSGRGASGTLFTPPDKARTLGSGQMSESLLGSDLAYQDVLDDPYTWESQAIVGNEVVNRANCVILESKGGGGYGSVKSWIDTKRLVPLRIEKYSSSGKLIRRIDTTKVATDDRGHPIPANLSVQHGEGSTTELDGSKIKHDVSFGEKDFSPEGLSEGAKE